MAFCWTMCPNSSNNIRHTPCLCLHMQQADREWLIRALCWTHACCSAEAVTYFTLSLSDNHTQVSTKGQEGRGEAGTPSPVCSACIPLSKLSAAAHPSCLSLQDLNSVSFMTGRPTETSWAEGSKTRAILSCVISSFVKKPDGPQHSVHQFPKINKGAVLTKATRV